MSLADVMNSAVLANVTSFAWRAEPVGFKQGPSPFLPDFVYEYESGDTDYYEIETGCDGDHCKFPNALKFINRPRVILALCLNYSRKLKQCGEKPPGSRPPRLRSHFHLSSTFEPWNQGGSMNHQHEVLNAAILGAMLPLLRAVRRAGGRATVLDNHIGHIQNLSIFNDSSLNIDVRDMPCYWDDVPNFVMAYPLVRSRECNQQHAPTGRTLLGAISMPPATNSRPECGGITGEDFFPRQLFWPLRATNPWNHGRLGRFAPGAGDAGGGGGGADPFVILVMRSAPNSRSFPPTIVEPLRELFWRRGVRLEVFAEERSHDTAVWAFAAARGVIAAHGGLLMHVRACRPGVKVIEFQPEHGAKPFMPGPPLQRHMYAAVGRGLGLDWHFYYPERFPAAYHARGATGKITLNVNAFAKYADTVFFSGVSG